LDLPQASTVLVAGRALENEQDAGDSAALLRLHRPANARRSSSRERKKERKTRSFACCPVPALRVGAPGTGGCSVGSAADWLPPPLQSEGKALAARTRTGVGRHHHTTSARRSLNNVALAFSLSSGAASRLRPVLLAARAFGLARST
jgi:hypothetical protein